jgi:circadian clock protein KaiB
MVASAPRDEQADFERAAKEPHGVRVLRLLVTGTTPRSIRAIENIKKICEEHLEGQYSLEVIDLYQQPELARENNVLAAPTLIRRGPGREKRIVGDLSLTERLLSFLDIGGRP